MGVAQGLSTGVGAGREPYEVCIERLPSQASFCEGLEKRRKHLGTAQDAISKIHTPERMKILEDLGEETRELLAEAAKSMVGLTKTQKAAIEKKLEKMTFRGPRTVDEVAQLPKFGAWFSCGYSLSEQVCADNSIVMGPQCLSLLEKGRSGREAVSSTLWHEMAHGLSIGSEETEKTFERLGDCLAERQNHDDLTSSEGGKRDLRQEAVADWNAAKFMAAYLRKNSSTAVSSYSMLQAGNMCGQSADGMA